MVKNINVFGDEVVIDLVLKNPSLQARKKVEVEILKSIHAQVYNKAKITIRFKGRELAHKEIGMKQVKRIEKDLEEIAEVEQRPKFEGRQIIMVIAPRK